MNPSQSQRLTQPLPGRSVKRYHPRPQARLRLFCFPWAGVGSSAFFRWSNHLSDRIEVLPVQYPGREDRLREPPLDRLTPLVELLAADMASYLDRPFAFWGHSLGALAAFELVRYFRRAGAPTPGYLFVSGRQAPHLADPVERIPDRSDEEFVRELQRCYGGLPEVIARDPEIRSVFLPTIRADLELVYSYVHEPGPAMECGISVFGGTHDQITRAHLEAWQEHTTEKIRLKMFAGDHFFVTSQTEAVLEQTRKDLGEAFPDLFQ